MGSAASGFEAIKAVISSQSSTQAVRTAHGWMWGAPHEGEPFLRKVELR
jgi:hypothetical protein